MDEQKHRKDPVEAHREGLEKLEHAPHHQTTRHDKGPHEPPPPNEPPGDLHPGRPLPLQHH